MHYSVVIAADDVFIQADTLGEADDVNCSRRAVFSVTVPHDEVYLVLRVDRVLQGDPVKADEPYMRPKAVRGH